MTPPPVAVVDLAAQHCVRGAAPLPDAEAAALVARLPGGSSSATASKRPFRFADYKATIAFVNAVAAIAEREDHHPELRVRHGHCVVAWTTHDAGGVTRNDVVCAAQVERLLGMNRPRDGARGTAGRGPGGSLPAPPRSTASSSRCSAAITRCGCPTAASSSAC